MSRASKAAKTGRRERHMARQAAVKAAKKKRRERAARFAHLPGQQGANCAAFRSARQTRILVGLRIPALRTVARDAGCEVPDRPRKAALIAIIAAKYEALR